MRRFLRWDWGFRMLHRICCKRMNGYFTVEASLVIPLTVFLFGFIFYLTFYLYDRCVASQDTYLLAFRGSICHDRDLGEIQNYVTEKGKEQFGKKYLGLTNFTSSVQADAFRVTVEVKGTVKASLVKPFLLLDRWSFRAVKSADRISPVKCVRRIRMIKKLGDRKSGGEKSAGAGGV